MRTCQRLSVVVSVLGLSMAACASSEEEFDGDTAEDEALANEMYQGIVNGEPLTSTSGNLAIGAVLIKMVGQEGSGLCTGTLVAPKVVLTAAHCVDPAAMGGNQPESWTFVTHDLNLTDGIPANRRKAVAETRMHPQWNFNNLMGGHDMAVLILENASTITPKPYRRSALTNQTMPVHLVGFGLNDGINQTGAGIKREARLNLNSFDDLFVKTGSFFGTTICNGDSGGPVLAVSAGKERIIGINSFGLIFCLGEASSTNVTMLDEWVTDQIDSVD